MLILSIGLAVWSFLPEPESESESEPEIISEPSAPIETSGQTNPPEKVVDTPKPVIVEKPKTRHYRDVPYIQNIRYVSLPVPVSAWRKYAWATAGIVLLLIAYLIYLYFNRKIRTPKEPEWDKEDKTKPRRFSLAVVGGKPAPLLDRTLLDEAADAISYFKSRRTAPSLDVSASIKATLDQGGLPDLRFHRRKAL